MKKNNISLIIPVFLVSLLSGCGTEQSDYSITVNSIHGKILADVNVELYDGSMLVSSSKTNEEGVANFNVDKKEYEIKLSNLPNGYYVPKTYKTNLDDENYTISCYSKVIEKIKPNDVDYVEGDIMYDFTIENTENEYIKLSNLFDTYEMVFINFFYIDCYWCNVEFPYLQEAYEEYSDTVAVLAISCQDRMNQLKSFKEDEGFTFDVCYDNRLFTYEFDVTGFPTSVIVDRFGVVTEIHEGAITSKDDFISLFDKYTGSDYFPVIKEDNEEQGPVKPTYTMPESSLIEQAINGEGFEYSWYPETDEEDAIYSWPWLIDENKGIYPSNSKQDNSYATIYTKVTLNPDEVFVFDYLSSCEEYGDYLYITVDDIIVNAISGVSDEYQKCFAFVPSEEGEYEIGLTYLKDADTSVGDDKVYIKNVRIIPTSEIDEPIYIKKHASSHYNVDKNIYENFVDIYYNENDKYYHVNSVNGPLLLADLQGENATHYNPYSISTLASNGYFRFGDKDYTNRMLQYCSFANNSFLGMCPVTEELKTILEEFTTYYYNSQNQQVINPTPYENQWLDICCYYVGYCTNEVEMPDPVEGLATFSAYEAKIGDQNFVNIDTLIMPRGKLSEFVPETSGVYKINSIGSQATKAWIFLSDDRENDLYFESDYAARSYKINEKDQNYCMYVYLEANTKYYICSGFDNMYELGIIQFNIEYIGQEYQLFTMCSPGAFTTENDDMTGEPIAVGIKVQLGDDGYYHELLDDNTLGSIIYCDFMYPSYEPASIITLIDNGYFDLTMDKENNESIAGGKNYTSIMNGYKQLIITSEGETKGCVPVDETLAIILQKFMDVYTFSGVENSWLKLCYYFKTVK